MRRMTCITPKLTKPTSAHCQPGYKKDSITNKFAQYEFPILDIAIAHSAKYPFNPNVFYLCLSKRHLPLEDRNSYPLPNPRTRNLHYIVALAPFGHPVENIYTTCTSLSNARTGPKTHMVHHETSRRFQTICADCLSYTATGIYPRPRI